MSKNKQESIIIHVMTLEWAHSPIHRGRFGLFLSYNRRRKVWSLCARSGGCRGTFASRPGTPNEDLRTVALELIGNACDTGTLDFESIIYGGQFGLTLKDLP